MQVEGGGDRHIGTDDVSDKRKQHAVRIVLLGRQGRAVRADIDGIDRQRGAQPTLDRVEQFEEKPVLDRAVGLGHRERDTNRNPRPGSVHRRDKARCLRQHPRVRRSRLGADRVTFEIGARGEMRLGRDRCKFIALDRKAKQCHAWQRSGRHAGSLRSFCRPPGDDNTRQKSSVFTAKSSRRKSGSTSAMDTGLRRYDETVTATSRLQRVSDTLYSASDPWLLPGIFDDAAHAAPVTGLDDVEILVRVDPDPVARPVDRAVSPASEALAIER